MSSERKTTSSGTPEEPEKKADAGGLEPGSRERLMRVATRLFAEKGLDGVTTRDLAREAGVNISLISYYFGGKENLYKSVIQDFGDRASEQLSSLFESFEQKEMNRDAFESFMRQFIDVLLNFRLQQPEMTELMMREMIEGLPHAKEIYEALFQQLAMRIITVMQKAQQKGVLKPDLHVHTLFVSIIHTVDCGLMASKCDTPFAAHGIRLPEQRELYAEQLFKIFIEGALV